MISIEELLKYYEAMGFGEVYNYLDKQPINDEIKKLKDKLKLFKGIL